MRRAQPAENMHFQLQLCGMVIRYCVSVVFLIRPRLYMTTAAADTDRKKQKQYGGYA